MTWSKLQLPCKIHVWTGSDSDDVGLIVSLHDETGLSLTHSALSEMYWALTENGFFYLFIHFLFILQTKSGITSWKFLSPELVIRARQPVLVMLLTPTDKWTFVLAFSAVVMSATLTTADVSLSPGTWPKEEFKRVERFNLLKTFRPKPLGFSDGKGLVAGTTQPFAVHAGMDALRKGGNAMDACLATALTGEWGRLLLLTSFLFISLLFFLFFLFFLFIFLLFSLR